MTVDSEAIFALAAHARNDARAFEALHGSMAAAWIDERDPERSTPPAEPAGRCGSATARDGIVFASTEARARGPRALLRAEAAQVRAQRGNAVVAQRTARSRSQERFRADESVESDPLPAVRAPREREFCLTRLAAIAAAF